MQGLRQKKTLSTYSRTFCSDACLQLHIVNTAKCPVCGDLLVSKGRMTGQGLLQWRVHGNPAAASRQGKRQVSSLPTMRGMFIAPQEQSKFCGVPCYRAWAAEQKLVKKGKPEPVVKRERACKSCGKVFDCTGTSRMYCSSECRAQKVRDGVKTAKQTKPDENICIACKTSQSQCERFTSNFTYVPKGATQKRIRGKIVVVTCPKFT